MADAIIRCEKIVYDDGSPKQYEFTYVVENNSKTNMFCVVVKAADMQNPASESEARNLANPKASAIKANWMTQEELSSTDLSFLTGNVNL